jgi:hypothetical protein
MTGRPPEVLAADAAVLPDMTTDLGAKHFLVPRCRGAA